MANRKVFVTYKNGSAVTEITLKDTFTVDKILSVFGERVSITNLVAYDVIGENGLEYLLEDFAKEILSKGPIRSLEYNVDDKIMFIKENIIDVVYTLNDTITGSEVPNGVCENIKFIVSQ